MSTGRWQWVPLVIPFDALPRIAGELSGTRLSGPEPDRVTKFIATTNPGLVRTIVRRWSGPGATLEVTQHVRAFSERGETPSEDSSWEARIHWEPSGATLCLDGAAGGATPRTSVYRFSGGQGDALERRWLAIIERDFFRPTWPEHPLVPASFRTPLRGIALATTPHCAGLSEVGQNARYPALFWTNSEPAWGLIVSGDRALPIGPLPRDPRTFAVYLERPSGGRRREALESFNALIGDSVSIQQVVAESGSANRIVGCASLQTMPDRVKYGTWRGAGWIVRSQLGFESSQGRTSRHGSFVFEWAIQSDRGSFALFARQQQSLSRDRESLALCVVARWPRWTYLRHLRKVFAADGWTWMKLHPASFWW